jgi:biotin carboxyl carrier protein
MTGKLPQPKMKNLLYLTILGLLTIESNSTSALAAKPRRGAAAQVANTSAAAKQEPRVVRAGRNGQVWEVFATNGQHVTQGQTLLKMTHVVRTPSHPGYQIDYEIAKKNYEKAVAQVKPRKATSQELGDARLQMAMAKRMLNDGPQQLTFSFVSAPISGTVSQRTVSAGDQLQANSLIAVITADPVRVRPVVAQAK